VAYDMEDCEDPVIAADLVSRAYFSECIIRGRRQPLILAADNEHHACHHDGARWVPLIRHFRPLTSLTLGGRNRVRSQRRPHGQYLHMNWARMIPASQPSL